jgi:predicted membrane channel-forming protein YqfA (hemolysin III family)
MSYRMVFLFHAMSCFRVVSRLCTIVCRTKLIFQKIKHSTIKALIQNRVVPCLITVWCHFRTVLFCIILNHGRHDLEQYQHVP